MLVHFCVEQVNLFVVETSKQNNKKCAYNSTQVTIQASKFIRLLLGMLGQSKMQTLEIQNKMLRCQSLWCN